MFIQTLEWFRNPLNQVRSARLKLSIGLVKFESYNDCVFEVTSRDYRHQSRVNKITNHIPIEISRSLLSNPLNSV